MGILESIFNALFNENSAEAQKLRGTMDKVAEKNTTQWVRKMEQAERDYNSGRISFDQYTQIMQKGMDVLKTAGEWEVYRSKFNR